ncbi:MAG TPA: carboxypeptidase regulatory-like domain-containing protein [Anaeromyxobacteraceae bacterium]|nr:carboxypeptidase regulatory-like domain-containing protein [Anaeromyxobacteraceae bacterium]
MHTKWKPLAVGAALLAAAPALAGGVRGTVSFTGAAPKLNPFPVNKDQNTCGQSIPDESVVVAAGKLKNVVITVKGPGAGPPVAATVVLDQTKCHYVPHVQVAPVGSTLDIVNSDPVLHNIHGYLGQATAFNLAMPLKGQKIPRKLDKAGLIRVKCDVHSWMHAWVVVADGPSAVSAEDGKFDIQNVPPGTYTVTAWHEKYGERTAQVTVPASGDATVDFSFAG